MFPTRSIFIPFLPVSTKYERVKRIIRTILIVKAFVEVVLRKRSCFFPDLVQRNDAGHATYAYICHIGIQQSFWVLHLAAEKLPCEQSGGMNYLQSHLGCHTDRCYPNHASMKISCPVPRIAHSIHWCHGIAKIWGRTFASWNPPKLSIFCMATEGATASTGKLSIQTTGPQQMELMQGTARQSYLWPLLQCRHSG